MNDVNIVRTTTSTETHWHNNNMKFNSDVEMNNVTFNKGITINEVDATLDNVTITKSSVGTYGLFVVCGSHVEIIGGEIKYAEGVKGRGIKVVTEDASDKTADTYLKVSGTKFTTAEKAAILAVSNGGTVDIELNNIDIAGVAADTEYAVWVDEDAAAYADKVRVVGGKMKIEGQIADGVTEKNGTYSISNANGMLWFAKQVNEGSNTFSGKTVKLVANINLKGIDWEPIGQTGKTEFKGTFDGGNFTISNLSVDSEAETGADYSSALFGWLEGHGDDNESIVIQNVKVNVATIKGHHNCAVIAGYAEGAVKITNCEVENAEVSCTMATEQANGDKAGVIVGIAAASCKEVSNCTAKNSTVSAGRDAGQVVGAGKTTYVTNCSAENVKVTANGTSTGANIRNEVIGRDLSNG